MGYFTCVYQDPFKAKITNLINVPFYSIFRFFSFSLFFFFVVLGLELRGYTLNHSNSSFFVIGFFQDGVSWNYLSRLTLNCDSHDLCLLSS
jgi:hypothetical protein